MNQGSRKIASHISIFKTDQSILKAVVKVLRRRMTALLRNVVRDAFDPTESGLEIVARADGVARGGRTCLKPGPGPLRA